MSDILEEADIPNIKAYRVRVDQFVQEILGTRDLESEQVWAILQPKLQDPEWKAAFVGKLRARWQNRDWQKEGL